MGKKNKRQRILEPGDQECPTKPSGKNRKLFSAEEESRTFRSLEAGEGLRRRQGEGMREGDK